MDLERLIKVLKIDPKDLNIDMLKDLKEMNKILVDYNLELDDGLNQSLEENNSNNLIVAVGN